MLNIIIAMSQKEIKRYAVIERLIKKEINGSEAKILLKLSVRQIRRLKQQVSQYGPRGLIHQNRGKPSNRSLPKAEKEQIIKIIKKYYYDFKPGLACEKLSEDHGLIRDPKTIRSLMIAENLWQPRRVKLRAIHRAWRQRRAHYGEMQQFDGSYHPWFEARAPKSCLLLSVDDATSKITQAQFASDEGVFPVFEFWLKYLRKHGKPLTIYVDKFSTYKMTQAVALNNSDLKTQFQRALTELHIEPIFANSPQAKGRVENMFKTLQDRLVKELRLRNISDVGSANLFLARVFIPQFNKRFAVQPRAQADLHQPLTKLEQQKLSGIFSHQLPRVVQNDFTVSYENRWYQLTDRQPVTILKQQTVVMEKHLDQEVKIRFKGKYLNYAPIPKERKYQKRKLPWVLAAQPQLKETAQIGHF